MRLFGNFRPVGGLLTQNKAIFLREEMKKYEQSLKANIRREKNEFFRFEKNTGGDIPPVLYVSQTIQKYFKVNDYAVNMNGISKNGAEKKIVKLKTVLRKNTSARTLIYNCIAHLTRFELLII